MTGPVTIAIANAKGGCAKTTSVLHLAVAFAERGLDVLAVDVDPQGTLTRQLGITIRGQASVKEVLLDGLPLAEAVVVARPQLAVLGADLRLASADLDLATAVGGDTRLRRALRNAPYDIILIDYPPAIGKLTVNALVAADAFIVPLEPSQLLARGPRHAAAHGTRCARELQPRTGLPRAGAGDGRAPDHSDEGGP